MKRLLLIVILLPAIAQAQTLNEKCEQFGLYSLRLLDCPQYNLSADLTIPLCQQPSFEHLAYLDDRCYQEQPQDPSCFEWSCPAPYDHVMVEPISGRTKIVRGSAEELDNHYRAARAQLGAFLGPQARTAGPKPAKHSSKR
jgi:hypothetical protein